MEKITITKEQFERLLGAGIIHFYDHSIYLIHWQTYFAKVALFLDSRNDEKRLVQLIVE
jgi:hypothetical protein